MAANWVESWLKNIWVHHALRLLIAALITVMLTPFKLDVLEYTAYDLRMQFSPRPSVSGHVVLIPIEYQTLKQLKHEPEALDWSVVLQKLGQAKPANIVSFINPNQIQGSYDDLSLLAEIAQRLPFMFGENDLPKTGVAKLDPLAAPFENIPIEAAPTTGDRAVLAKDGASRRLILSYENQLTLHPRLAEPFNGVTSQTGYPEAFQFLDSTQMMIRFRDKGTYPTITFADLLNDKFDPEMLRGKIILIGKDTMEATSDYVTTPMSKDLLALSQLEMHANILDTLIMKQAPRFSPDWVKMILTFLVSLLTIYIVLSVRPGKGLVMLAASVVTFLLLALLLFALTRWVIPVAHPLVAVFICYYFVIPYRLIIENRKSWEYYEKNRLLTQVEELKSNFMRMMSHDLRTPLARIQGMTELIRKEEKPLNDAQVKALDTISESSEELTEFIGSILSLSRIESKEMKLHLRSRDINQLMRAVIRKVEYLAKKKNIEIVEELEPLFSVKVDEDLLKTVFTNLLENAIKYSAEGSKILVTTEDHDSKLVIQVADQGRGIHQKEVPHIFERFYRAQNSRVDTQGSGLGLYLAKYFVELHNGWIEAESEINKGSTFSVHLPVNQNVDSDQPEQGSMYV